MKKRTKSLLLLIILLLSIVTGTILYFALVKKENAPITIVDKFSVGKKGNRLGEFDRPLSVVIKDNHLYVADTGNNRIQILRINPDGNLNSEFIFGKKGNRLGEFDRPLSVVIKDNHLYVADTGNNRIQILRINPDGNLNSEFIFGKKGTGLGEFSEPIGLGVKDNFFYVTENFNNRIQILRINPGSGFTPQSAFELVCKHEKFSFFGVGAFMLGLTVKDNHLYVSDTSNNRIQILRINPDGNLNSEFIFGKKGTGLGEFSSPTGVTIEDNYLYVADSGNNRIQVLEIKY